MDWQPERISQTPPETLEFEEPETLLPLELMPVREGYLDLELPEDANLPIALADLSVSSSQADAAEAQIPLIEQIKRELEDVGDEDLKPARIQIGLLFVGVSALLLMSLLLYITAMHPGLTVKQQMLRYWSEYVGFVGLGVAGLMMLGREAMRSPQISEEGDR
ncbi:hypothetical protein [Oscillatoria sp. HE19RPO]|uniref:hypothetical protein n=1 Tax=Oscillatoria sp. HE19RPO TaxID=2954806 RepID=UPI0020C35636|nr:hypothetical protein [Oscillatoria sp. HE19RPO]